MLAMYLTLSLIKKKRENARNSEDLPIIEDPIIEEKSQYEETSYEQKNKSYTKDETTYERKTNHSRYDYAPSTYYVRKIGSGAIFEISGNRLKDMRDYSYYRIEGENVISESRGLVYIIQSNKIKSISGSYMYEISGDHINKVFGGYFASISGNYITKHDLSEKIEVDARISTKMLLLVTVLAFGEC